MKKIFLLLMLFNIFLVSTAYAATIPLMSVKEFSYNDTLSLKKSAVSIALKRDAIKKHTWYDRLQGKIIPKIFKKQAGPDTGEISKAKKVLSVLSLALGGLSVILLFALGNAFVFACLGAIVTGLIALPRNRSKKHRTMAIIGIVLGLASIAVLVIAIDSAL